MRATDAASGNTKPIFQYRHGHHCYELNTDGSNKCISRQRWPRARSSRPSKAYDNSTSLTSHTTAAFISTGGDAHCVGRLFAHGRHLYSHDNFGNTYIPISGPTSTTTGFDLRTELWYVPSPMVGANHTVTMGLSTAQPLVMSIFVLKGSNIPSPLDGVSVIGSDNGSESVNVVSPTITTTVANDLLIGFAKVSRGCNVHVSLTWFLRNSSRRLPSSWYAESGPAATLRKLRRNVHHQW